MKRAQKKKQNISLAFLMTAVVVLIVLFALIMGVSIFLQYYKTTMEQHAITTSEQAVVQVQNMVTDYTEDMNEVMDIIRKNMSWGGSERGEFFLNLLKTRKDVVAIMVYSDDGRLTQCWSERHTLKENIYQNLSYIEISGEEGMHISSPHVASLFQDYYPWVVTISQRMEDEDGDEIQIAMDISFDSIASYVDDVGIGQHGYCFIMDKNGNIVYHPQQQLIYSGLKEENIEGIQQMADGSYKKSNVIYTIYSLENCGWRMVGVSYVEEMITDKVFSVLKIMGLFFLLILITAGISGIIFANLVSRPAKKLAEAMYEFEKNAEEFTFCPIQGSKEIMAISDSFGHMVGQVQELMDKVRKEEITLRKTELNALQAQINPHFLYNTLDSIAWMCEEERTQEAVVMVNALARLFRISISRGHELITIEKECQHAESYLKIQKFRYKNQFSYEFKIEESCRAYLCNKITLQPIIENAIYHGLDMSEEGNILIEVYEKGDTIVLSVTDNGVGMSKEQCEEILHKEASDKAGIGIKNVNDRIRIYFGENYGLNIKSELDEGTRVEISIPKVREETYAGK